MLPAIIGSSTSLFSAKVIHRSNHGSSRRLWTAPRHAAGHCWRTTRGYDSRRRAISTTSSATQPTEPKIQTTNASAIDKEYLKIPDNALADRWETDEPSATQLRYADLFFQAQAPKFIWSEAKFRSIGLAADANAPELAFLGRSNVGKSSLLNALLGRKICHTSSKPGRTKTMNGIAVNGGKLVVVDMPGYGKGSREEWGKEILKYLSGRRTLRRAFLLIDALHGVKSTDAQLLTIFRENAIPHQIILSKVDRILFPTSRNPSPKALEANLSTLKKTMGDLRQIVQPPFDRHPPALGEILTCSAEKSVERGKKMGVSGIRWAMLAAAGLERNTSYVDLKTAE